MDIINNKTPEVAYFFKTLEELTTLIEDTLQNRTPTLNGERYLTNKDMQNHLKLSIRTLQEYRDNGTLPFIQIGGKIWYRESEVVWLLEESHRTIYK